MSTLNQLTKRRAKFEEFLTARGAQILQPTNEWEMLRFRSSKGVSIVYRNAQDDLTWTGESADAWNAFTDNLSWRGSKATKRPKKPSVHLQTVFKRDGPDCFFCWCTTTEETRTLEHLVAVAHGGPNHLSNFVIACRKCNGRMGHMSAMEKIRIRERNRSLP